MATPLEMFDALEVKANAVGRGSVVVINIDDASTLKALTVSDLVRRGVSQKSADYICGILSGNSEPFRPLGDLLGVQIKIGEHADNLIQTH